MNTTATSYSSEHSWIAPGSRRGSIESILSIQGKETDFVRDTSDTEEPSDEEYEPLSEPDDDALGDSSGDSDEIITTRVIEVALGDSGDVALADGEQTDSDGSDSEIDLCDYWRCAQCRATNNNPLYRYCEKCFKVRKTLFPPPPRGRPRRAALARADSGADSAFYSQETGGPSDPDCDTADTQPDIPQYTELPADIPAKIELPTETQKENNPDPVPPLTDNMKPSVIVSLQKRRAESADRNRKRRKVDYSDTESDSSDNDRRRKSKSADPEVKPLIKTISDPGLTIDELNSKDDSCIMCYSEPKSGVFVHGRIAHICCCYKCAVKVWSKSKRCPVCNCKVSNVLKAVVM